MARFTGPELLGSGHMLERFSSGESSLDDWLCKHAHNAKGAGSARSYVICDTAQQGRVVGYHALTVTGIGHRDASERLVRGMGRHPIPAVVLARLAVDRSVQRQGLGALLLRDAMLRAVSAAEGLGIRALVVHALHAEARAFYLRFGFEPSPTDDLHLAMLIKDVRASLGGPAS
jgi:GNAT superfamily N-acetyltransferase